MTLDQKIRRMVVSREAVLKHVGGGSGMVGGAIRCPICKTGNLRYSITLSTGRIFTRCTTKGCVSFTAQ